MGYDINWKDHEITVFALRKSGCTCEKQRIARWKWLEKERAGCEICGRVVSVEAHLVEWYAADEQRKKMIAAASTTTIPLPPGRVRIIPPTSPSPGPAATRHAPAVPVGPLGPALPQQPQAPPSQGPGAGPQFHHQLVTNARGQVLGIHTTEIRKFDYKTHWLLALRPDGISIIISRWERPPTAKEVSALVDGNRDSGFLGFAVVNTVGLV